MQVSFTIPTATLDVSKRDGSLCVVDLAQVPSAMFADFLLEGIAEYIRDSSSAALANAYDVANPDDKSEGEARIAARKAWGEVNVEAVKAESRALMEAARDRLYAGERSARRAGAESDPLATYRYKAAQAFMRETGWGAVLTTWQLTKKTATPARMAAMAEAVASLGEEHVAIVEAEAVAMQKADAEAAKRAAERRAKLAAKIDVSL